MRTQDRKNLPKIVQQVAQIQDIVDKQYNLG